MSNYLGHLCILPYHLQIVILWFLPSQIDLHYCIIGVARMSNTIFNRYGLSGQLCLVPDFNVIALCFFQFSLVITIGFLHIAFVYFV